MIMAGEDEVSEQRLPVDTKRSRREVKEEGKPKARVGRDLAGPQNEAGEGGNRDAVVVADKELSWNVAMIHCFATSAEQISISS